MAKGQMGKFVVYSAELYIYTGILYNPYYSKINDFSLSELKKCELAMFVVRICCYMDNYTVYAYIKFRPHKKMTEINGWLSQKRI